MKRILLTSIAVVALLSVNATVLFARIPSKVFRKVNPDPVRYYKDDGKFYFIHEVTVDSLNCTSNSQSKNCGGLTFTETEVVVVADLTENGVSFAETLYRNPGKFFQTKYRIESLKHGNPLFLGIRHEPPVMTEWGNTYNRDDREITSSVRANVFFDYEYPQCFMTEENENSCVHWRVVTVLVLVIFFTISFLIRPAGKKLKTIHLSLWHNDIVDTDPVIVRQTIGSGILLFFVWLAGFATGAGNYQNMSSIVILIGAGVLFVLAIAYGFVKRSKSLTFVGKRLFFKIFIFISLIVLFAAHYGLVGEIEITRNLVLYVSSIIGVVLLIRAVRPLLAWCKELRYEISEFGIVGFVRKKYSEK